MTTIDPTHLEAQRLRTWHDIQRAQGLVSLDVFRALRHLDPMEVIAEFNRMVEAPVVADPGLF